MSTAELCLECAMPLPKVVFCKIAESQYCIRRQLSVCVRQRASAAAYLVKGAALCSIVPTTATQSNPTQRVQMRARGGL